MAHALFTHQGHTLFNRLFRPRNDDPCFHDVSHGHCGRCFALENNIPRVVPFGDDANELGAIRQPKQINQQTPRRGSTKPRRGFKSLRNP